MLEKAVSNKEISFFPFLDRFFTSKPGAGNGKLPLSWAGNVERILLSQPGIDLALTENSLTGQADIRSSRILELSPDRLIVAQTVPPLGKSQIQKSLGASVVYRDIITNENTRWGWTATVLSIENEYLINRNESTSQALSVINLSRPDKKNLVKSNLRHDYRLKMKHRNDIIFTVNPMTASVHLLDLSAGGFMFSTQEPSKYDIGQELSFKMIFPAYEPLPIHTIQGHAVIVRKSLVEGKREISFGLKFQDLNPNIRRALPKILHYYMLKEQRRRNHI